MLDALGSLTTSHQWSSRKRSAVDMMNSESSTTANNLFLCQGRVIILLHTFSDHKSLLYYYGNYQVDVLRKKGSH